MEENPIPQNERRISRIIKQKAVPITLFLLILNIIFIGIIIVQDQNLQNKINSNNQRFELVSKNIVLLNTEEFLEKQKNYEISYGDLKNQIVSVMTNNVSGKYGFYYEDLETGAWIGYNEREKFFPQSLFKVPLMITVLKKVEKGELSLDQKVILLETDLDPSSGTLYKKGAGYEIKLKDLLKTMIEESDNTAVRVLASRYTTYDNYLEITATIGLPPPQDNITIVTPKEYINIFRSLYISSYLRRPLSEFALSPS